MLPFNQFITLRFIEATSRVHRFEFASSSCWLNRFALAFSRPEMGRLKLITSGVMSRD